jgi:uncharacterized protein
VLIQFAVENFLSFRDKIVFSMLAPEQTAVDGKGCVERGGYKLLRCAALYGANAAGKSNFIKAIEFARNLTINGTRQGESTHTTSFKLNESSKQQASLFDFELLLGDVRYSYGFRLTAESVLEEWLYKSEHPDTEELLFERHSDGHNSPTSTFNFNGMLRTNQERSQFIQFVSQGTRRNQLFLAEAAQRNVYELEPLFNWFKYNLAVIEPTSKYSGLALRAEQEPEFREFLSRFLRDADTGIATITTKRLELDRIFDKIPNKDLEVINSALTRGPILDDERFIIRESGKTFSVTMQTLHQGNNNTPIPFDIEEESDGTRRLMHLAPALHARVGDNARLLCVDELDRSLHPLMTRRFVSDFLQNTRLQFEQLIFTTHDTNLLSRELIPPDSVWFAEKDQQGVSHLYPLSNFKQEQLAQLSGSLEAGYLNGRFGAIPFFADRERLGWFSDEEQ